MSNTSHKQKSSSTGQSETTSSGIRVTREYVESLVIALVLAFLFKAFIAEAFVIPTGSMATTLMGRHKDVDCPRCGFSYQINASEESNDGAERPAQSLPAVMAGTCPQCRWTMYVGRDNFKKETYLSYNGDRIFVNKSQFDFRDPRRWHVTVFRYPGRAQMNYIKRLVGLENESVRLHHGDVFTCKKGESEFKIERKPLRALLAMLRPVDDNNHVQPELHQLGWPTRWFASNPLWTRSEDYRVFRINAEQLTEPAWLNYRHIVPSSDDWYYLSEGKMPPHGVINNPQLITDFIGYNSGIVRAENAGNYSQTAITIREVQRNGTLEKEHFCRSGSGLTGLNWVGDLAVSCRLKVEKQTGSFQLRLVKGGESFHCTIDLSTGQASLSIPSVPEFQPPSAATPVCVPGKVYELLFCNVDEELRLIVDGKEIDFQEQGAYDRYCDTQGPLARDRSPTEFDLTPAGFSAKGTTLTLENLKVLRDMYYIACDRQSAYDFLTQCDLLEPPFRIEGFSESGIARVLSLPNYWKELGKTRSVEFEMGENQFLMLGDNSAKSKDSRLWTTDGIPHYVTRDMLIGEAVFVYWPHGYRIPGTRLALIPNFLKMRFID